jgi:hypothetical protein
MTTITRLTAQVQVPTFHWEDTDAGGVRIFRRVERHLADVDIALRPHMMDTKLLRCFGISAPGTVGSVGDMHASAVADLADFLRVR